MYHFRCYITLGLRRPIRGFIGDYFPSKLATKSSGQNESAGLCPSAPQQKIQHNQQGFGFAWFRIYMCAVEDDTWVLGTFQWDPFWLSILIHPADVILMFSFPLPWWQLPEVLSIGCGCQRQEGPFALQEDSHFDLSASQNKVQSSNFSTSCNIGLMQLIVYSLTLSLRWIFDSFFQTWNTQKNSLCDYFNAQEESTIPNCYAKRVCRR